MRSGNPALNTSMFEPADDMSYGRSQSMTIRGTVHKCFILLGLCFGAASLTWGMMNGPQVREAIPLAIGGALVSLIVGFALWMKPTWSPVAAPIYAIAEGLFLGALSSIYESQLHGVVFQALLGTFGTMFAMLFAYQTGLIKATERFKHGVIAATGGIMLMYLAAMVMRMLGMQVPFLGAPNLIGIGISALVIVVAALNFIIDFDAIVQSSKYGAPKYCEWVGAHGLMVTMVWLYIEILRILLMIASYFQED